MNARAAMLLFVGLLAPHPSSAQPAASLANRGQEMSNWCWAATSEMIIDWQGTNSSQPGIANFAVAGANIGNYLDTGSTGGWGPFRIPGTNIVFFQKGIKQVLEHFGAIKSEVTKAALPEADAKGFLDNEKPFIVAEYWSDGGGHVMVAKDYAGSIFAIEDPWPLDFNPRPGNPGVSVSVAYSTLRGTTPDYRFVAYGIQGGNTWEQTLTLGRSLDIVFLIDSTASMTPYINNVKSQATTLISSLKTSFADLRIAVVDYRDFPQSPYGSSGDYITKVRTAFTSNTATAAAAINAIIVGGGNDTPEAVFSAVTRTAVGTEIGGWRSGEGVSRHIILMGDAPGHSPEPWSGGESLNDCATALQNPTHPINLQGVHVGQDGAAGADFSALALVSGGQKVTTINASDVSGLIAGVIEDIAERRFPVGETPNAFPTFTWASLGGGLASAPEISSLSVEIELNDTKRGWRKYKRLKVKPLESTSIATTKLLPIGEYRWRLIGSTKAGGFAYPDGSSSKGDKLGKFVEDGYTEFERLSNAPGPITKFGPTCAFSPTKKFEVFFEDDPAAEAYAIWVVDARNKPKTKKFKRRALEPGGTGVLSATLTVKSGTSFCWFVQGLNYDRKKPDPAAFN